MWNMNLIRPQSLVLIGLFSFVLSSSCATNEDTYDDPEEFLSSLDPIPVSSSDSDQLVGTDQNVIKDRVEDFAIDKNYETFDPSGIVIKFEFDSDMLTPEAIAALDKIVSGLKKDALARIFVRGHADQQGPEDYNDDLSRRRSIKIFNYLTSHGIDQERLIRVHLGESEPLIDEYTVRAFRQNRRGDFSLDYGGGAFTSK